MTDRELRTESRRRVDPAVSGALIAYGLGIGLLSTVLAASFAFGIPMMYFTSDPVVIPEKHLYNGFLSNIGVLLWLSAAVACLVSYAVVRNVKQYVEWSRFFLVSGLISIVLMLDDLYLFHDYVMIDIVGLGQEIVYAGYLALILGYIVYSAKSVLKTRYWLFLIALGFFAVSMGFDVIQTTMVELIGNESIEYFLEDGSKFLGLVGWSSYFIITCVGVLRPAVRREGAESYLLQ